MDDKNYQLTSIATEIIKTPMVEANLEVFLSGTII